MIFTENCRHKASPVWIMMPRDAQPPHRQYADRRAGREENKGEPPADRIDEDRHQVDGHQGQQKSGAGLHREHGANLAAFGQLSDAGGKLRRIGDHTGAPDQAQHDQRHQTTANRNPTLKAHRPLMVIAVMVTVVRPSRSASTPPTIQPIAPAPHWVLYWSYE